jgi:hypothetical protein
MNEYKYAALYNSSDGKDKNKHHITMYKKYDPVDSVLIDNGSWRWFSTDEHKESVTIFSSRRNAMRQFRKKYNVHCIPKFKGEKTVNIVKMMEII